MPKKVIIVHGWSGYSEEGWFPWLKNELESRGFEVVVPQMPQPEEPRINNWVPALSTAIGTPDENTYLVGHSMGCQAIARYLETLPEGIRVGGAIFVAGFFKRLTNLEEEEAASGVAEEWLHTTLDLVKVKSHLSGSVAIFSDNDQYVPPDNQEEFANILGSEIIVEHEKGHFSGSDGVAQLPVALEAVLGLAG